MSFYSHQLRSMWFNVQYLTSYFHGQRHIFDQMQQIKFLDPKVQIIVKHIIVQIITKTYCILRTIRRTLNIFSFKKTY